MDIKQLNEEFEKFLTNKNLKEDYDDFDDEDEDEDEDEEDELIPSEAQIVSDGPGAASYIMEKDGKYYVYWGIYDGGEEHIQEGGVYDSKEEAYDEIVDDFSNFDDWDEIEDSCSFYDDTLKQLVKDYWSDDEDD